MPCDAGQDADGETFVNLSVSGPCLRQGRTRSTRCREGTRTRTRTWSALDHRHNFINHACKMIKRSRIQEIYSPPDVKIPRRLGGGILKERVIRELPSKRVVSYALAYINPMIFSGDNGRVLGYDNSHDYSHRHYLGKVTTDFFTNYEDLYEKFEREWQSIAIKFVNGEPL